MAPRSWWRTAAVVGTAAVLLQQLVSALPPQPRQGWGVPFLLAAAVAVAVSTGLLMPRAAGRLWRHPDLVVPLVLLTLADGALGWLQHLPGAAALLTASRPVHLLGIGLTLSCGFVLSILLHVAYAAWATTLVLDVVRRDRADLAGGLAGLRRWFVRVLALESVGWVVLFAGVAMGIAMAAAGGFVVALVVIGAWGLVWNLATAALLPVALDDRLRFGEALARGIRVSWQGKGRWWAVVVGQMLLLGFVTLIAVSYTETTAGGYTAHSSTNWSVNGFWTGGYDNDCRWYGKLMEALAAPRWSPVATALGLLFGALAIVVKLHVTAWLPEAVPAATEPFTDSSTPGEGVVADAPAPNTGAGGPGAGTDIQANPPPSRRQESWRNGGPGGSWPSPP